MTQDASPIKQSTAPPEHDTSTTISQQYNCQNVKQDVPPVCFPPIPDTYQDMEPPPYTPPPIPVVQQAPEAPYTAYPLYNPPPINTYSPSPAARPKQCPPPPPPKKKIPPAVPPKTVPVNTFSRDPDEIPPQYAAAYGLPPKSKPPVPAKTAPSYATTYQQQPQPTPSHQEATPFYQKTYYNPAPSYTSPQPTYSSPSPSYTPAPTRQPQTKSVASGAVVCTAENFYSDELPLHFLRQEKNAERLYKIFNNWISSGFLSSRKLEEAVHSQPVIFDDIHMIPFLWIQLTFACDGCIGYYERPFSTVICLWNSPSPYRGLLNTEVPIPVGKIYKFDHTDPNAKTLHEIDNPSFLNSLSGWFKSNETLVTKDVPKVKFEDSKEPTGVYADYLRVQTTSLTKEYKQQAYNASSVGTCSVNVIREKSKVTRVYIPFCFTSYTFEGKLQYVLINAVNGDVYGSKKKSIFGVQWNSN